MKTMDFDSSIEVPSDEELGQWTLKVPAKAGVYLLWGEGGQGLLLATTGNLRAAVRRKLQPEADQVSTKKTQLDKITKGLSWRRANSNFAAFGQYHQLARELYPQKYRELLGWKEAWWVKICLSDKVGRISATKKISVPGLDEYVGPWANGRAAKYFIDLATDAYGLCRNYEVLKRMNANSSCTYAQIGSCCGVCQGKITVEEYRRRLAEAAGLAEVENRRAKQEELKRQMNEAAAKLDFEAAESKKKLIGRIEKLNDKDAVWAGNLRRFVFLVIGPGSDRKHVQPLRISGASIDSGEEIELEQIESKIEGVAAWARQMEEHWPRNEAELQFWRERVSMVSYFLFRRHSDQCLYYKLGNLPSATKVAEQISRKFSKSKSSGPQAQRGNHGNIG